MDDLCDFGLIGLAVMGENLALNVESRGYSVAVFNRTTEKVDAFVQGRAAGKRFVGCHSVEELVKHLKRPRRVMLLVKAGPAVDSLIQQLIPLLEPGDVIIDGGNTHYMDTERRTREVEDKGLLFVGSGVSGGEEGALKGPSLMPGGSAAAWPVIQPIFQAIAAKVGPNHDIPCCEWVGPRGAGHYVKMVHNGIEYGDMQLICEAYYLLKHAGGLNNDDLYDVFAEWNRGELQSYLIEITRDIFSVEDDLASGRMVDQVLDVAGAKGTGKWMSQLALDLGVPSTLVTAAVYARCLSAAKDARTELVASCQVPLPRKLANDSATVSINCSRTVPPSSKPSDRRSTHRRYAATPRGSSNCRRRPWSTTGPWILGNVRFCGAAVASSAQFLDYIKAAFDGDKNLENLLLAPYFQQAVATAQTGWRDVASVAMQLGLPTPAFSAALAYYDGYREERLPANLLQAQRDYFGAHTYQRVDREGVFHTDWLGLRRQPDGPSN